MSVGSRIKELRDHKSISRNELAKKLDVTPGAISNYENGVSSPKEPILFKIMDVLECDANYLYQDDMDIAPSIFTVTLAEQGLLTKYRALDTKSKGAIDTLIEYEYEQTKLHILAHEDINEDLDDYGDNVVLMPSLIQKICAGTGSIGDDIQLEEVPYPALRVPHGAKYAATISGDSMEPKYSDGDVIFFDDNPCPELGDIVVMNINEENYIKKYTKNGFEALNQKYDTIVPGEDDHVAVYGKVLGKL